MHDDALTSAPENSRQSDDLLSVLLEVEETQRQLLLKISMTPAENSHDVMAKLEIWKSVAMPGVVDPEAADPMDLLVSSVLADLQGQVSEKH